MSTSSTAQGGRGSLKNRKPIGEIGCCESRMAERSHWWTDRWLRSLLFLSLSFSFSEYLPAYLHVSLSVSHPITNLSSYLSTYLSIYLSIRSITPVMINCFSEWNQWSRIEKRSNSARLPQFLHLTTSKTKQFCETSYFLKLTTSKTKQFCETPFKNGKLSAELTAS